MLRSAHELFPVALLGRASLRPLLRDIRYSGDGPDRRHGVAGAYEQLKDLTRGKAIDGVALHAFIRSAPIPADARDRLLALTPRSYVGKAAELARAAADAIDRGLGKGAPR